MIKNKIIQQAGFAGLIELQMFKEISFSSKDGYDFQKDLDHFVRYFQEKVGHKPPIEGTTQRIERYKLIPMELKKQLVPTCLQAMDYLDFRERFFEDMTDALIDKEPAKAEETKKKDSRG